MPADAARFSALRARAVPAAVADQIRTLIAERHYAPGDRLPPERALAEQLGVGRNALREALTRLEVEGLVEIRHGRGTFVRAPGPAEAPPTAGAEPLAEALRLRRSSLPELVEARLLFETMLVELAIERATPSDLRRLEEILAEAERPEALRRGRDRPDMTFEDAIAQVVHNEPLRALLRTLHAYWTAAWAQLGGLHRSPEVRNAEHREILAAIAARDRAGARAAVARHLTMEGRQMRGERVVWDVTALTPQQPLPPGGGEKKEKAC